MKKTNSPTPPNQKTPHNRTLSDRTQNTSSIAPAEDAELREKNTTLDQVVRFIVKTIRDDDKLNPGQPELILQDVAGILRSAPYFTQQASRIRAEVME